MIKSEYGKQNKKNISKDDEKEKYFQRSKAVYWCLRDDIICISNRKLNLLLLGRESVLTL